jgi:hypothetical protein
VVYDQATEEAHLERLQLIQKGNKVMGPSMSGLNEEVFLAQLHRRSLLLNEEFQDAVREVIMHHATAEIDRTTTAEGLINSQSRAVSSSNMEAPSVDNNRHFLRSSLVHLSSSTAASSCEISSPLDPVKHHVGLGSGSNGLSSGSHGQGFWKGISTSLMGNSDVLAQRCPSVSTESHQGMQIMCKFSDGIAAVEVLPAPIKTLARMREKVLEYSAEATKSTTGGNGWPHAARIVDPIRASIVCNGPAQILEAFRWFSEGGEGCPRKPICRVKNRFSFAKEELLGG